MSLPTPYLDEPGVRLFHADCLDLLPLLDAESIHACVCDPPYGLSFMGKGWDHAVPGVAYWEAVYRVLKPGAHLLAFGGTRTFHRLACAIEDAGFEMRDTLMWVYGSGFPKSLDVSKAIDKAAGVEREVVGEYQWPDGGSRDTEAHTTERNGIYSDIKTDGSPNDRRITAPATTDAREWTGWGTALKPAWEPIILARKPLRGTVAANVLAHGTGALNIDGCRIGTRAEEPQVRPASASGIGHGKNAYGTRDGQDATYTAGRFPANVIHDGSAEVLEGFPLESRSAYPGNQAAADAYAGTVIEHDGVTSLPGNIAGTSRSDSGSAARFFYTAKTSPAERGPGNSHPTVKPVDLMAYLCRLVTPPGGTILDPFFGSGSTALGAIYQGFNVVAVEIEAAYCEIAVQRLAQGALFAARPTPPEAPSEPLLL